MTNETLTKISGVGAVAMPEGVFVAKHLIDGQWKDSLSGETFERLAPSNGALVSRCAMGGEADVEAAIAAARQAFDDGRWSDISGKDRATYLTKLQI